MQCSHSNVLGQSRDIQANVFKKSNNQYSSGTFLGNALREVRGTCFDGKYSIKNMMLRQHIFKEMKTLNSLECLVLCKEDVRCQSFNYVINHDICELNNRTKEAAPKNFVQNFKRY